jgi:hypothetical protein
VSPDLLQYEDADVKLFVACCAADVLRIYAPEAPYADEQLKVCFEHLPGISLARIKFEMACNVTSFMLLVFCFTHELHQCVTFSLRNNLYKGINHGHVCCYLLISFSISGNFHDVRRTVTGIGRHRREEFQTLLLPLGEPCLCEDFYIVYGVRRS